MRMDIADFPIVKMDYSAPYRVDFREILDGLDELFAKQKPFVIIGEGESSQEEADQVKDVRMEVTAWANQRKALLNRWVLSSFMIIPAPKKLEEMRLYAPIFEKFWQYPFVMVASKEEAYQKASALLAAE
ncbi:MAG: hypothetical protein ACRCXK_08150 [Wohlfahrtiimonas sp.]